MSDTPFTVPPGSQVFIVTATADAEVIKANPTTEEK